MKKTSKPTPKIPARQAAATKQSAAKPKAKPSTSTFEKGQQVRQRPKAGAHTDGHQLISPEIQCNSQIISETQCNYQIIAEAKPELARATSRWTM